MSVVPQHYKLLVAPNIAENTFRGEVDIFVSLIEPTAQIVLHQLDLEIGAGVHVSIGETQWAASSVKADNDAELLILDFAEPLPVADSAVLHLVKRRICASFPSFISSFSPSCFRNGPAN